MKALRSIFLSHGGGPLPLLGDEGHRDLVEVLASIAARHRRPAAIVVVSAHWEADVPTLTVAAHPGLIYDYSGFPEESYRIGYPCPGAPELARRVADRLGAAGMDARLDGSRGLDHGVFVPMKIMYPEADIPCVQLSLLDSLDPAEHLRMGRALADLATEDVLVVGSGFSFHNLRAFFRGASPGLERSNAGFEEWLLETCASRDLTGEERERRLLGWEEAPGARDCHPREEHLLPLHVCYGVARDPCYDAFELRIMGRKASIYLW